MTAVGSWKVTLSTPMGPQTMLLHIDAQGADGFTGRIESPMGNLDVVGEGAGDKLHWVMDVAKPMPIKVTFDAVIDGAAMRGTAKMGMFGKADLTGERTSAETPAALSAPASDGPVQVTADFVDPQYNEPYIEVNEERSEPEPHRYVRGGFKGTDARFSFYFPPKARYAGRFFHNTYPMATTSDVGPFPIAFDVSTGNLGFTFDSGAYYVQTNLGGADRAGGMADPAIGAYRVNAAAAKYSRVVAAELYGEHQPYGYLFGGSGGSYQVMGAAENTSGVWDGFVPFVMGSPNSIPSMFTVRMHALRVLRKRNRFPAVMDAINPGGGDPYAELNEEEAGALREATQLGYPPRGWWNHEQLNSGHFTQVAPIVPMLDPSYVEDFWTKPGYLGADPASSVRAERFQFDTTVAGVIDGFPKQIELASTPERDFADSHLVVLSGAAAGKSVPIATIEGETIGFAFAADQVAINSLQPGDHVRIDNSWPLALQTYQRHQVPPTTDLYAWNQYRGADGQPLYPQRGLLIGPMGAAGTAGSVPIGKIHGKVLALECLMDIDALAWQADWYRSRVKEQLGDAFEDGFALWFIDHAQHDNPPPGAARAHTVSFEGALQQALRDLSAWVETGERPSDTQYKVVDAQVQVPATAAERKGVQPVVELQANGGVRAEVKAGEPVTFTATIATPPGAGSVVAAEWDFEGVGDYPDAASIDAPRPAVSLTATYAYARPGTYFPVLRATSQRQGDPATPYGRIQNLARARVVVR